MEDMDRAMDFYRMVFGFHLEMREQGGVQMAWFPMAPGESGSAGSLVKAPGYLPSTEGVLVYFTSPEMDEMLRTVERAGGNVLQGRTRIGEHGFVAFVRDTEGNRIGLHSRI